MSLPAGCLLALQPPGEEQREILQHRGHLEQRLASAYRYANHEGSPALAERAHRLSSRFAAEKTGAARPLEQFPPAWNGVPSTGTIEVLVFLIDFADQRAADKFPGLSRERVHANLFASGTPEAQPYAPRESMRNFYQRASNGRLTISGQTLGWYHFPGTQASYRPLDGDDDIETNWAIAEEVLLAYDAFIDYSQFDNDGDGFVDALNIIWSGEIGEWASFWWGYRWVFFNEAAETFSLDGVRFRDFSWQWVETRENRPGDYDPRVIIHEFGHLLGLPDLYDYQPEVGPEGGVGGACVMDSSESGNFNAYFRWLLGWIEPERYLVGDEAGLTLSPAGQFNSPDPAAVVYFETPNGGTGAPYAAFSEMLVIENRQPVGNDGGISEGPTGGLSIWHVDGTLNGSGTGFAYNNSKTDRKLMRLLQKDGLDEIEQSAAAADPEDLYFPGDELSPWTYPAAATYAYTPSRLMLDGITETVPGTFTAVLSAYAGPLVRASPSHLQLKTAPGLDHPPTPFTFYAEDFTGALLYPASSLLQDPAGQEPIAVSPDAEATRYLYWNTADKPLHLTREVLDFAPASPSVPPVRLPVQAWVRIPLEDALSHYDGFWETGRHRPWFGQTETVFSPPSAAASGKIGHDRQTFLSGWVWGPGSISFQLKVSSEPDFDRARFQIDGSTRLELSGERDWQHYSFHIAEGGWVPVRWLYVKDGNGSAGADGMFVDDVVFTPDYTTRFEDAVTWAGLVADPASRPFPDGRPLLEHYAYAVDPADYLSLASPVAYPAYEILPGEAYPLMKIALVPRRYGVRYTPQASPDGTRWYTLRDGEEGVRFLNFNWGQSSLAEIEVPLFGYRFFRVLVTER